MVGGALKRYFEKQGRETGKDLFLYDKGKNIGSIDELNKAEVIFVCVPTPFLKDGKGFDLSYNEEVCSQIIGEKIIVLKSTILPGITEYFQDKYPQHKFLFNPEFLKETSADWDMNNPERQIVGHTARSKEMVGFVLEILPPAPYKKEMPATEAELVKYFGNNFLAIKVAFANQMYEICKKLGVSYDNIAEAASRDSRIGKSHLSVSYDGYRGYGGTCFPKDIRAMIQFGDKLGIDLKIHKAAEELNNMLMEEQGIDNPEKFSKRT